MPQLNPEFFVSQLFWLAVFFTFLLVFLWKISLPRIATVLEKRQNKIDENLLLAKELQEQSQEIEKNINNQINKTLQDSDNQIKEMVYSINEDVALSLNKLDKELDEKISKAEKEIAKKRNEQLNNIDNEIINITKSTISKIANISLSDSEINEAVKKHKGILN